MGRTPDERPAGQHAPTTHLAVIRWDTEHVDRRKEAGQGCSDFRTLVPPLKQVCVTPGHVVHLGMGDGVPGEYKGPFAKVPSDRSTAHLDQWSHP